MRNARLSRLFIARPGSEEKTKRTFETEMILKALRKTAFVQTRAAELLGISRRILKYKMDKLGISDSGEVSQAGGEVSLNGES